MFANIAIAATSTVAALAAAVPATAAPLFADATRSVSVSYVDLDLAAPAGQDELGARIRRAAASVCGAPGRQLDMILATDACRTTAVADAQSRMAMVIASNDMRGGTVQVAAR